MNKTLREQLLEIRELMFPKVVVSVENSKQNEATLSTICSQDASSAERIICPHCGTKVRSAKFQKHLANSHPTKITDVNNKYAGLSASLKRVALAVDSAKAKPKRNNPPNKPTWNPNGEDALDHAFLGGGFESSRRRH